MDKKHTMDMRMSEFSTEGLSLYGRYILEREGKFIVEDEHGYATYLYLQDAVYIEDIFVLPEFRRGGEATKYVKAVENVGIGKGLSRAIGSVVPSARGSTESIKAILSAGYKLDSARDNGIFFYKDLKGV